MESSLRGSHGKLVLVRQFLQRGCFQRFMLYLRSGDTWRLIEERESPPFALPAL